jgi:CBS domain-containing protein
MDRPPRDCSGLVAAKVMAAHHIHAVVVSGSPALVVSDADVAAALAEGELGTRTVAQLGRPAATIGQGATLEEAARIMREHTATHAVVVDPKTARPVGMLSVLDIAEALSDS